MRNKEKSGNKFIPIEQLLLSDTPEIKKLETLRGKEENYAYILGPLEFTLAVFYTENPRIADKDIAKILKRLQSNYSGSADESTLEGMLKMAASLSLQEIPVTTHEFLLCIDCILGSIENRSWIPDNRAYLRWIANFFGLLSQKEKRNFEHLYSEIQKETGVEKDLFTKGKVKGKLKLEKAGKNSWSFGFPSSWSGVTTVVYDALELLQSQKQKDVQEGAAELRDSVEMAQCHPLALSQYGFFLCQNGDLEKGRKLIEDVVNDGRKLFPAGFTAGKDLLEWSCPENRPFLRCLCWLGMEYFHSGRHEKALEIFEELLKLNPDDNPGIRETAIKCYFALKRPEKSLELCGKYKDDCSPAITYGKALALFQINRKEEGEKALKEAVKYSPLVAKELLQPSEKRPKSAIEGCIASGGADEAWKYREMFGQHWEETTDAMMALKSIKGSMVTENEKAN